MVTEINLYVEGGGDNNQTRSKLRQGFSAFLSELVDLARSQHVRWKLVACGSRKNAYDDFENALWKNPNALNILVVDSEDPIKSTRKKERDPSIVDDDMVWQHLYAREKWARPENAGRNQCFLMTQCMETWLIADKKALQEFYGKGFLVRALPKGDDIEAVDKDDIYKCLRAATANCPSKGEYHKTRHGFDILAKVNPKVVRDAAPHCERLFSLLADKMRP